MNPKIKKPLQVRVHLQGLPCGVTHTMKTPVSYHNRPKIARGDEV